MELEGREGGSLEPVGDGADMFDGSFSGHERRGYPFPRSRRRINFYKTHGRGKKASATGR